jgi:hypothetical protein
MLDTDGEGALKFLKKHLEREVKAAIYGEGVENRGLNFHE